MDETDYQTQIAEQAKSAPPEQVARYFMEAIRDDDLPAAMRLVDPEMRDRKGMRLLLAGDIRDLHIRRYRKPMWGIWINSPALRGGIRKLGRSIPDSWRPASRDRRECATRGACF